jgi:hypothetical protein
LGLKAMMDRQVPPDPRAMRDLKVPKDRPVRPVQQVLKA